MLGEIEMRATLLIALLALAATAAAEDKPKKPKTIVKPVDKSSPVLMQAGGGNDETHTEMPQSRAKDYNSSRSNTSSRMQNKDGADYNSSRSNKTHIVDPDSDGDSIPTKRCENGKDDDCNAATPIARGSLEKVRVRQAPANHNTTRSNRTSE
jgi:hypothetical protein